VPLKHFELAEERVRTSEKKKKKFGVKKSVRKDSYWVLKSIFISTVKIRARVRVRVRVVLPKNFGFFYE
jgi:hypothetical protein